VAGFTPDQSKDQTCRYTGTGTTWACFPASAVTPNSITSSGISEFSPWAVCRNSQAAVTLESFTVIASGPHVLLQWVTSSEINSAGFNLYRAVDETGARTRVNAERIAAGGGASGASYSYTDLPPAEGPYVYWLEEVDDHGATTLYGPVAVRATGGSSVWLPVIVAQ
jgi:hypothetical protein